LARGSPVHNPLPMDAIRVSALSKRYGDTLAVDGIDFVVPRGATVGLLGGNGAGKTRMNFSSPYVSLPHRLTVAENLRVYGHLYDVRNAEQRIGELARDLAFTELLHRKAGQLSAGQKTRVALAKALINRPELLLLDEPTASLDPDTADFMRSHLEQYRAGSGCTILLASHNMAEVERLCSFVLMMKRGRIVDRGTPEELLRRYGRDDLEAVFLDIARGRRTAEALP
jgi:ABC-2 type transport system ATP-binding protein